VQCAKCHEEVHVGDAAVLDGHAHYYAFAMQVNRGVRPVRYRAHDGRSLKLRLDPISGQSKKVLSTHVEVTKQVEGNFPRLLDVNTGL
jgi:hypothetical protein